MTDNLNSIKAFIHSRPVTIRKDIYYALDIPQRTLTWNLKRLTETGQVVKHGEGYYFRDSNALQEWLIDNDHPDLERLEPMNTRDKILNHLESNKPTSAREFHQLTGAPKSRITQLLRELTESGQLEIHSVHNGIKRYRLTELHANRRQAILDWLDGGSEGTSGAISAATGVDLQMTTQILASLSKQGEVYREWLGREKVWLYRKNAPFIFGCANQMTAFINQRLKEVRA
ncbi:hypothetical protein ACSRQO_003926 [Enterobacter hormaechei]